MVLVGDNPASEVYIGAKTKIVAESGMRSIDHRLEASTSREALLALVASLNCDPEVHGILVQLPLPPQIDPAEVTAAIDPAKDVDGFHTLNVGRIALGLPARLPAGGARVRGDRPLRIRAGRLDQAGATVIDVGVNRVMRDGKRRVVGDVAFEAARWPPRLRRFPAGSAR